MNRILTELTLECEITARMYAQGYEKKRNSGNQMSGCQYN